jgi:hypothetical protein
MVSNQSDIKTAVRRALEMMRDSGFGISGNVEVMVDPSLPFMGYSTQRKGGNIIVVAGRAVETGMIEGLLIHELCHIYRTEQKHPSHNSKSLDHVGLRLIHEYQLTENYQIRLVQQAVNHIQDLYADDLSFGVFQKSNVFGAEQAFEFFLDWISDAPTESKSRKARWLNVQTMLNNCFAISNLTRHRIADINSQAENKTQAFLSKTDLAMQREFPWFRAFMTNLKENPSKDQFEKDLTEYLTRAIKLARTKPRENTRTTHMDIQQHIVEEG